MVGTIQPVVTSSMNSSLTMEFSAIEVAKALTQMHSKKASEPDEMSPLFYLHYWSIVGNCVTQTILDCLNCGIIPPKFNETRIVLIPKVKTQLKLLSITPLA